MLEETKNTTLTFGNDFVEDVHQLFRTHLHVLKRHTHTHTHTHTFWLGFSTEEAPQTKWVPADLSVTQTEAVSFYLFWHISRFWLTATLTFPLCCQNTVKHRPALVHQHQILFLVPVSNFNRDISARVSKDEYSRHQKARGGIWWSLVFTWWGEKLAQSRMMKHPWPQTHFHSFCLKVRTRLKTGSRRRIFESSAAETEADDGELSSAAERHLTRTSNSRNIQKWINELFSVNKAPQHCLRLGGRVRHK